MKLLVCLILILTIFFSNNVIVNSVKVINKKNKLESSCFENGNQFTGITSEFISSANNNNNLTPNGVEQFSSLSNGTVSVDLNNGLVYLISQSIENPTVGQLFGFADNNTQYYYSNGECYVMPISFNFPIEPPQLNNIGEIDIGSISCDLFQVENEKTDYFTSITALVDQTDCSLVNAISQNPDGYPSGGSLTNFYNFSPNPNQKLFQLPSTCIDNAIPITSNKLGGKSVPLHILNIFN